MYHHPADDPIRAIVDDAIVAPFGLTCEAVAQVAHVAESRAVYTQRVVGRRPDVREWLPEGHLAHHVSDLVDGLDLTAFYALYEGDGRRNAPYEPRMMVKNIEVQAQVLTGVHRSGDAAQRYRAAPANPVHGAGPSDHVVVTTHHETSIRPFRTD